MRAKKLHFFMHFALVGAWFFVRTASSDSSLKIPSFFLLCLSFKKSAFSLRRGLHICLEGVFALFCKCICHGAIMFERGLNEDQGVRCAAPRKIFVLGHFYSLYGAETIKKRQLATSWIDV